ncbi:MAG: TonB-dependent receptor [Gammaproteobacteria bacterium]|nr:TonB-dependent receptor [Gammaproteobacteria bacterium]
MTRSFSRQLLQHSALTLAIVLASQSFAEQPQETSLDSSTIVYEANFFSEFSPVTVNDMINRIPGIRLTMNNPAGGGSRGLGSGRGEILINGQRITGKSNAGRSQLSRISADQVNFIEIIRGTSDDLDVRGGGQVINVVLLDAQSRSSISAGIQLDRYQDGTLDPGGTLSYTGQTRNFNYLYHFSASPNFDNKISREASHDAIGNLLETREEEEDRDETDFETGFNLGYQFDNSLIQFNGLYAQNRPRADIARVINDYSSGHVLSSFEREGKERNRENWEIGGDYEYEFGNGSKYRFLFIVNNKGDEEIRERFNIMDDDEQKDLYLYSNGRDQERIARTSYTFDLNSNQALELGVERAQTIRDSDLRLGLAMPGTPSAEYGGLVPSSISNSNSMVEELRYENFAVHNWQLNSRMSLESSLIYETSTIKQRGDINNKRDFDFLRPKVDYRFDITHSLQLRASVEKEVLQLSFADFSSSTDTSDDDQNTQAGNPDIVQEEAWRYDVNLEYRLPNDIGVLNAMIYYRDMKNVIDRIDVSPGPEDLQSARGNIGDARRYGMNFDASAKLGFVGLPSALMSVQIRTRDSQIKDPFLGTTRRLQGKDRWSTAATFRHDLTRYALNYGFSYSHFAQDGSSLTQVDITDIETNTRTYGLDVFVEKTVRSGNTYRFEIFHFGDQMFCRERIRFEGATVNGVIEEVEDFCSTSGAKYTFTVRHTF